MRGNQKFRLAVLLAAVLLLLPSLGLSQLPKRKGAPAPPPDPTSLVWPPPPEVPRVRYEAIITGEKDVQVQKKTSWVDRIAGKKLEMDQVRLKRPYGVAVGKDGRIYVADIKEGAILIFDRQNRSATSWKGNAQIPLSSPVALALDAQSRLFVSDSRAAQVVIFSPEGKPVAAFGGKVMQRPAGLAIDERRGRLYVGDVLLHQVLVYDLNTLQLLKRIGSLIASGKPPGPGSLSAPTNLALDREGRLFVSDTMQCRVVVFDPEGKFLWAFGERGDAPGNFARPKGIALDSEGHVYVLDAAFGNFQIFDPDGQLLLFVGSGGNAPGQFTLPTGMAIDSQDRIYVAEQRMEMLGRLQIFQYLRQAEKPAPAESEGQRILRELREKRAPERDSSGGQKQ